MKTLYLSLCTLAVLLLSIETGCSNSSDENDPYGHKMGEFRLKHGMMVIPPAWKAACPIGQKGVAWTPLPALSKGYASKDISIYPDGTMLETDIILSGRIVQSPDPDGGKIAESLELSYKIKDGVIVEKQAYTTLEGTIDFEKGRLLLLQWTKNLAHE